MAPRTGILLYSGGLDSLLAARILLDQGIELIGLHFVLPFFSPHADPADTAAARQAARIGLSLRHIRCGRDYMDMVERPAHGYGKHINPCIDCKIFFLQRAREEMERTGAAFVATGEVVGQRPMSQMRHMLNHIEHASGLDGYLLRPLSARLLKPTVAEDEGIVDRERLLDISGRSRRRQMELAARYGIEDYASPAGGCLFTDANYERRLRDLFAHRPDYDLAAVYLLSVGRHFRLNERTRLIVARNEREGSALERARDSADCLLVPDFKGPTALLTGDADEATLALAGSIMLRYGRPEGINAIQVFRREDDPRTMTIARPIGEDELKRAALA
ncbi:MAG TPA: hypothetical protein PLG31_03135 [Spirochaetota bacterium]|nr:hypothetical protein [Spirochaetota bacterium]